MKCPQCRHIIYKDSCRCRQEYIQKRREFLAKLDNIKVQKYNRRQIMAALEESFGCGVYFEVDDVISAKLNYLESSIYS